MIFSCPFYIIFLKNPPSGTLEAEFHPKRLYYERKSFEFHATSDQFGGPLTYFSVKNHGLYIQTDNFILNRTNLEGPGHFFA